MDSLVNAAILAGGLSNSGEGTSRLANSWSAVYPSTTIWNNPMTLSDIDAVLRQSRAFERNSAPQNTNYLNMIDKVIFNEPATIVYWKNGDKTVVKCDEKDSFSKEAGVAMAIVKYMCGNKGNFNDKLEEVITREDRKAKEKKEREENAKKVKEKYLERQKKYQKENEEEEIRIQKEAYKRALLEIEAEKQKQKK